jgi:hypothetical protein
MTRTRCCSSTDYQSVGMACMHGKIIFRSSVIIAAGCCVCSVASERGHLFPFCSIRLFAGCGRSIACSTYTRMLSPCLPMREPVGTLCSDTHSYCSKALLLQQGRTRVVIHNYTLRGGAAGPQGYGSYLTRGQRPRTRSPLWEQVR